MVETSTDQYGRKTWDVKAYEEGANQKQPVETEISPEHLLKDSQSSTHLEHRQKLIAQSLGAVKTYNIINPLNANNGSFGKNKRFGFFCPLCNLSFRDNLTLIDHFNSPQHAKNARKDGEEEGEGEVIEGGVKHATLEQVKKMMQKVVAQLIRQKSTSKVDLTFEQRVQKRKEFEERKRSKRREKKQKKSQKDVEEEENSEQDSSLQQQLGFSGFGSTKKG